MKATDLRIGNWLNGLYYNDEDEDASQYCKVVSLDSTGASDYPIWVESNESQIEVYNDFQGIPLTEEILIKAGLKKYEDERRVYYVGHPAFWIQVTFEMSIDDEMRCYFHVPERNGIYYTTLPFSAKYLHELQNVYHSLSNKELNIEL